MNHVTTTFPKLLAAALCLSGILCEAREIYSLDGTWKFTFQNEKEIDVPVPHTWNAIDAAAGPKFATNALSVQSQSYKRGKGVYVREIPVKIKAGKRYFVRGEGASIVSEVFVNGKFAGKHEGAFGAFCYEITDFLAAGTDKNSLKITADNTYNDDILPLSGDFSMFGGLYRSVTLIETDKICIDPAFFASPGVFIRTEKLTKNAAEISVETKLNGSAGTPIKLEIKVFDGNGKIVANKIENSVVPEGEKMLKQIISIKSPILWNGRKNPHLYKMEISVSDNNGSEDKIFQNFGIRSAKITKDKGFELNRENKTLRGVCRHQDFENKGWAVSKLDEKKDIDLILEMGADALRTAHYPQTENIYDLCDQNGIVVWSEVPAIEKVRDRPKFIENMKLQAKEMILQHGNHPSICVWGIYNEIFHQTTPEDRKIDMISVLKDLNKFVKEIDRSRETIAATNQFGNDALNEITDHLAANLYPGWYGGGPETMSEKIDQFLKRYPTKGFAISEYGHGADISAHEFPVKRPSPGGSFHPEEWQSFGHEKNYEKIKEFPQLWGTFIWNMFDFASANRKEGAKAGINDKGLVTYDRKTKKDAFFFYKANWNEEPMIYLTSKRYENRPAGKVEIKAYTNSGGQVTLSINGKTLGNAQKANALKIVKWENIELKSGKNKIEVQTTLKNGKKISDSCIWTCE